MEKNLNEKFLIDNELTTLKDKTQRKSEKFETQQGILKFVNLKENQFHKCDGTIIGRLVGISDSGEPLIDFRSNQSEQPLMARSTVRLDKEKIGKEIVLIFEEGDPKKPIIIGFIRHPEEIPSIDVEIDGERMTFSAKKEIILRCGKASITLTKAGKVLIRGAYLLNRSSGVNRIKGGSVQIN